MRILIVYATSEGQTRKVVQTASDQLKAAGHETEICDSSQPIEHDVSAFDAAILAGSIHQKEFQSSIVNFIRAHVEQLNALSTMFLSVNIAVALGDADEAQSYIDKLKDQTGWTPTVAHSVAGAIKYTEYDFFVEQILRHIVLRGRVAETMDGDHEFTDWNALEKNVASFLETCQAPAA